MLAEIISKIKPNIVIIRNADGSHGTGIILDNKGVIVTNSHVVGNARLVRVETNEKKAFIGNVITANKIIDYAFILCEDLKQDQNPVLSSRDQVLEGEDVVAIGHPLGYDFTVSKGIISSASRELRGINYIQTDVSINPGNSGGPLLDAHGEILGINTWIVSNAQGLSFTVPASYIKTAYTDLPPVANITDVGYCVKCGHLNEGVVKYCQKCGSTVDSGRVDINLYTGTGICPGCKHSNGHEQKYCQKCGGQLILSSETAAKQKQKQKAVAEDEVIKCPACGTENKGKSYCSHCGKTLKK